MQVKINKVFLFLSAFMLYSIAGIAQQNETPERIISLAPSLTKNLHLLKSEDRLIGCTNYCTLQAGTSVKVVANAVQVNYEQIILLDPDLIITTNLTKNRTIETFKKLGIRTIVFDNPKNFEEICEQFIELGKIVGAENQANRIIQDAKSKVNNITLKIPEENKLNPDRVFMQLGANPLFTVIPGTFMHDYMAMAGASNIAMDLNAGSINIESVLLRDPDIIFIVLMGMVASEEKSKWMSFDKLNAVKNNRIYTIDADKACSPTPLSFVETLEEIVDFLYMDYKSHDH